MRNCRRTQHLHSTVTRHSNKLKKWKSSLCGLLISWLQIKEIIILKCCLLLLNNNEPFLNLIVRCGKKGFYTTGSDDQLTSWTEKKLEKMSQSQTCTKKSHGHCLVVCFLADPYSFLNPGETITSEKCSQQIDEMHRKMQCLQPVLVHRKGPILLHNNVRPHIAQPTTNTLKVERIGLRGFASSATFTWPLS